MHKTSLHKSVVFIGAGNVATHLSQAMLNAGFSIQQIFSRTVDNAKSLADIFGCTYTTDIKKVMPNANVYIFSLKDDALQDVIAEMSANNNTASCMSADNCPANYRGTTSDGLTNGGLANNKLWIHTAGSVDIEIFRGYAERYGVIYPMQTMSKSRETDFSKIPLFVEGCSDSVGNEIYNIASMLSKNVTLMSSEKRKYLHLAAVFAGNFSNHMYSLATQIVEEQGIDRHVLQPLIDETANKLYSMSPEQAQTGPAIRYDRNIIERHLSMLEDENLRKLYTMISKSIHENSGQ